MISKAIALLVYTNIFYSNKGLDENVVSNK